MRKGVKLLTKFSRCENLFYKALLDKELSADKIPRMAEQQERKRKKRKKTVLEHWLLYVLLRIGLFFVFLFPVESCLKTARSLGRFMWKHYGRGRQRALDNLRASFPDKDEKWIEDTGRRSFECLLMMFVDVLFSTRLIRTDNWEDYSRYINCERAKWMMQGKQPMLLVTPHYGNFEIIGYLLGEFGFDIYSIARPLDNKFINKFLYDVRQRKGQKIIDKKGASDHMEEIVKKGATLCFVADQDAWSRERNHRYEQLAKLIEKEEELWLELHQQAEDLNASCGR